MSINSSTSSISTHGFLLYRCLYSDAKFSISAFVIVKNFLFLPLSSRVLYLGHQRWRQQRSFATMSHSDIFIYHMAAVELVGSSACPFYFCGLYTDLKYLMKVGYCLSCITGVGETLFHILTCVERYLAAVHPVTYMGLKKAGGVRIRNISIGCVWLISCGSVGAAVVYFPDLPIISFCCILSFSFIVVTFCSLRVLCVLIRPGPGEVVRNREQADQSKQRAFHTIMAITGVLWLWSAGYLVCLGLSATPLLGYSVRCVLIMSGIWFSLPSSLVLPLLFLHRAGKLPFSCSSTG